MRKLWAVGIVVTLAPTVVAGPAAGQVASTLFAAWRAPAPGAAEPIGSYARGCLTGAVALPETGPSWQIVHPRRNRHWAHPAMVSFIARLGRRAQAAGWPRLLVGDISQPRGGPMPGGHRSHQIGLDADIWLHVPSRQPLDSEARENFSAPSLVRADGRMVSARWRPEHAALIRLAAEDPAVARIFVNAAIKKALCRESPPDARGWLRKVRPWWGHKAHMHVRLHCPANAPACVEQAPPPSGDGCGAELSWWFSDEALHPKPPVAPPRMLKLADLPAACRSIAGR